MAIKPSRETAKNVADIQNAGSIKTLNMIREMADEKYAERVPIALPDGSNLQAIGTAITSYEPVYSQFMGLMGRIAFTIVRSIMFENPLRRFKKGLLEVGESVQEFFVKMVDPNQYDELEDLPDWHMLKLEKPEIEEAYYHVNYEIYYKQSVVKRDVRRAFTRSEGVSELLERIVQTMYTSASYDEYLITMYLLAKNYLDKTVKTYYADDTDLDSFMGKIRGLTGNLTLPSTSYNVAGVENSTDVSKQVVLVNPWFEGKLDAESLAYAFNMGKADYLQSKVVINSFSELNTKRILKLLSIKKAQRTADQTEVWTAEEHASLAKIKCFIVDEDWFGIWDEDFQLTDFYNGEKKAWSYWLHVAKIVASGVFQNAVCVTSDDSYPALGEYVPEEPVEPVYELVATPSTVTLSGSTPTASSVLTLETASGDTKPITDEITAVSSSPTTVEVSVDGSTVKFLNNSATAGDYTVTVTAGAYTTTINVTVS